MLQKYEARARKALGHTKKVDVIQSRGTDAAEENLRTASNENIDTIIVGSRGVSKTKEFLLGSISYKVSHYADVSATIIVR
jgi:nucleotide-binding universal stress UspA family protein